MAEFYIDIESITRQSTRLTETGNSVRAVQNKVNEAASGLAGIGLGSVAPAILALGGRLALHVNKMNLLSSALGSAMLKYVAAESGIMGLPLLFNSDYYSVVGAMAANTVSGLTGVNIPTWEGLLDGNCIYTREEECVVLPFLRNTTYSWNDDAVEYKVNHGVPVKQEIELFNYGTEEFKEQIDNHGGDFDQASTIHSYEVGASASISALSDKGELSGTFGSLSGEYGVLNAEAKASAYAGFISEDGKFAPGIGAEASASVSLFKASGEARLGNDYLGMYAKGEVEVCSAEATAAISAGLYDSEGNLNPSLGASVGAEAVLAQATASTGYRVMGTDVGVQGSVGFGVGAHAHAGIQDGKFMLSAGVYAGVGGSVSLELDFGDTYDTMVSAWNDVTDFANSAADTVSDVADSVANAAGNIVDGVAGAVSDGLNTVSNIAGDAWDYIHFGIKS